MKIELDNKLCEDFPLLFRDRHMSMQHTCMCWGFPGDGWEPIIREAATKLEPLIQEIVNKIEEETNGNPECVCGQTRHEHENGTGKCLKVFQLPKNPEFLKKIRRWGFFSIPSDIYKSKKLKDRIYVGWRRFKSWLSYRIEGKIQRLLNFLCDKNILYRMQPSWCKEFKMQHPAASQIKEKFGTLRFYLTSGTEEMWKIVHEAENKSCKICEECGAPGKRRGGGWILTLCDEHAKGREAEEDDDDDTE